MFYLCAESNNNSSWLNKYLIDLYLIRSVLYSTPLLLTAPTKSDAAFHLRKLSTVRFVSSNLHCLCFRARSLLQQNWPFWFTTPEFMRLQCVAECCVFYGRHVCDRLGGHVSGCALNRRPYCTNKWRYLSNQFCLWSNQLMLSHLFQWYYHCFGVWPFRCRRHDGGGRIEQHDIRR